MTLFSLDVLVEQPSKKLWLAEINGINSGMNGFRRLYGDDRVEINVKKMLVERYGRIAEYGSRQADLRKWFFHPLTSIWSKVFGQTLSLSPFVLNRAHTEWTDEEVPYANSIVPFFESYWGQRATVFNRTTDKLSVPSVNSFIAEQIAANKFLQYALLKNSSHAFALPPTTLVGMGYNNRAELDALHSPLIFKPLVASQGRGIVVVNNTNEYVSSDNFLFELGSFSDQKFGGFLLDKGYYMLEHMVGKNDFTFECGMGVLQQFIETRKNDGLYRCVRVILCCGKFVDAYTRTSPYVRSNLSQGAGVEKTELDGLKEWSEGIIGEFLGAALLLKEDFQKKLYEKYFETNPRSYDFSKVVQYFTLVMQAKDSHLKYHKVIKV